MAKAARVVRQGVASNDLILSSHVGGNEHVFPQILDLYVLPGSRVADVTYGRGVFWKHVPEGQYEVLATDIETGIDCRALPYGDGSIDCLVLDPPYMHSPGGTAHVAHSAFEAYYQNNRANRTVLNYHEAVLDLYCRAIDEAQRVLRSRGVLIVKCQDEVCANQQRFTHIEIAQHCEQVGFQAEDLFVVQRMNRPGVSRVNRQVHARKNHSYFLVFWKRDGRRSIWERPMNAIELMQQIIKTQVPDNRWSGAPLGQFRQIENTNRGRVGEEFVRRYLKQFGIDAQPIAKSRLGVDLAIGDLRFEVKTASEDTKGGFQFNHVRYDREYDYLLCLGVQPDGLVFGCWSKEELATQQPGKLVRMAEGQSVTFKLRRRPEQLLPIHHLPTTLRSLLET